MLVTNTSLGALALTLWWGEHSRSLWELVHSAWCFGCFSHQIYTLLSATGNLERGDVRNLRAAETGFDEGPDATGISILNRSDHLGCNWNKASWEWYKTVGSCTQGHRPTHVYRTVYLLLTQGTGEEEERVWSSVHCRKDIFVSHWQDRK